MSTNEQWEPKDFNLLSGCIKELNSRGSLKECRRFWRKALKHNVVKPTNGKVIFKSDENIFDVAKDNLERFLNNFLQFHNETINLLGNRTKDLFDTGEYILYVSNDLRSCSYIKNSCDTLKFSWSFETKNIKELSNTYSQSLPEHLHEQYSFGELLIYPIYNWYDIWQIWCYITFSKFLSHSDDDSNSFIKTLNYFCNYYGYSHNYIVTK